MILQGKDFLKWGNLSEQRRGILSERYSSKITNRALSRFIIPVSENEKRD